MATYGWLCPTPKAYCCGAIGNYSASLDKQKIKKHGSPVEAMKCYSKYLVEVLGYTKIGPREFKQPDGPILVISKHNSFGARLRSGKSGEGAAASNSRGMPAKRHGGAIISS